MAESTISLAAFSSSTVSVTPRSLVGIESTQPVRIFAKNGAQIAHLDKAADARIIIPPSDTITITAGPEAATITVDKD